ncbi:hypothetical protein ACWDGI_21320 [Streptomyces sp. NPDC001220]
MPRPATAPDGDLSRARAFRRRAAVEERARRAVTAAVEERARRAVAAAVEERARHAAAAAVEWLDEDRTEPHEVVLTPRLAVRGTIAESR